MVDKSDPTRQDTAIAKVSHEMRNALHSIVGMAELLAEDPDLNQQQRKLARTIWRATESLDGVVNDLLSYSQAASGRMKLDRRPFSPAQVADQVARQFRPSAEAKGLTLVAVIDADIPETVLGDDHRVRQVVTNLVSNAVKYTERGHIQIGVETGDENAVQFNVSDTGPGIPKAAQATIFDPYEQAELAHSQKGTGLGLAIARQIVSVLGGELRFVTGQGGTNFFFELPYDEVSSAEGPSPEPSADADASGHILVVDDSATNRMLAVAQLERLGYTAIAVDSGAEALKVMAAGVFDAVLMDWNMPGIDGLETTQKWRAKEKTQPEQVRLPIVVVTARAMADDRQICLAAGASDYLAKPASTDDLARVLKPLLAGQENTSKELGQLDQFVSQVGTKGAAAVVLETFAATLVGHQDGLQRGLASNDSDVVGRIAHTIAPSAEMIGERRLAELCRTLEAQTQSELPANAAEQVESVVTECSAVISRANVAIGVLTST